MRRVLAAVLLVSACQRAAVEPPATSSSAPPPTTPPTTAVTSTAAPEPVTAEGDCPYLATGFIEQTVGQRIERTTYTTTSPDLLPGCAFFRPDGDPAAQLTVTEFPTARQAQAAAIAQVSPAGFPVDGVADGGVVEVSAGRTVLAVTSGTTMLVVTINQESSLEARAIAEEVAPLLQ